METVRRKRVLREKRLRMTSEAWALVIFIVLTITAPLAFGAVDRIVQIGLLLLLGIGVWCFPPVVARPGRVGNALIVAGVAILLLKEFGPSALFGSTQWRTTLSESYGVVFPWTHHPEPSRALDGLLAGIAAVVWFHWTRTLAVDRSRRVKMIWGMLASAAIVSIVSFSTRGIDPEAIYGMRYTPGWFGFGPFPNRNHTACFLTMGVLLGAGCVGWAGARRDFKLLALAIVFSITAFAGLLATQSRGGVIVLAAGLGIFLALVLMRFPSVRAVSIAAGAVLMIAAVGLGFGAQMIARFSSKEGGEVSNLLRVDIWKDALRVWKDAPIFGHGIGTFTQIFPMYQEVETGGAIVLHPESSWLQWLVEFGALPVLCASLVLLAYVVSRLSVAYSAHRSIFMRAGPFAAAAAIMIHSVFDVPAHRWGTAGFALAALAIACAPSALSGLVPASRKAALVPAGIAVFWMLTFLCDLPAWSPLALTRLLAREQTTPFVSVRELERSLRYFPLNPTLHYSIAAHQLDDPLDRRSAEWQQHCRVAVRLMPGSWEIAAMQARACARVSPGISLHYWQIAVERAGHRAEEVLGIGMEETIRLRGAAAAWEQYVDVHPEFLLTYARHVPEPAARQALLRWWENRASRTDSLGENEVRAFYSLIESRGTRGQFDQFCQRHPELRPRDFATWVGILHRWDAHEAAWRVLAPEWSDPTPRAAPTHGDSAQIARRWDLDPNDFVNARDYAEFLARAGDQERANEIIVAVANRSDAPEWFVKKAARIHATDGDFQAAVALFLREKRPTGKPL